MPNLTTDLKKLRETQWGKYPQIEKKKKSVQNIRN